MDFPHTLTALENDGNRRSLAILAIAVIVLGVWAYWFAFTRVTVFEVAEKARVEVGSSAHRVQAEVTGKVVRANIVLGREVAAGDVLVELDTTTQRLQLDTVLQRQEKAVAQRDALLQELGALRRSQSDMHVAERAAIKEAKDRELASRATADLAREEADRLGKLRESGHLGEFELLRSRSQVTSRAAEAGALGLGVRRIEFESRARRSDKAAELVRAARFLTDTEADLAVARTEQQNLEYEISRRMVRAPVSGTLGEIAIVQPGSYLTEGAKLCSIIPAGALKIVAEVPERAIGRIRPGQSARARLAGFSWMEYGSVPARVESVDSETNNGVVRVELSIADRLAGQAPDRPGIPIQHGLSGTVQIDIERVSPAVLALRSAGRLISGTP